MRLPLVQHGSWGSMRMAMAQIQVMGAIITSEEFRARLIATLGRARCLQPSTRAEVRSRQSEYLSKLRSGVHLTRLSTTHRSLQKHVALQIAKEGGVVTEVSDAEQAERLELWQQGNLDMYSDDKLRSREKLRHDVRVRNALELWWQTALVGVGDGMPPEDPLNATIDYEHYNMMMKRIYRVMIKAYDANDAEAQAREDWRGDSNGEEVLNRAAFGNGLFQLADMVTAQATRPYRAAPSLPKLRSPFARALAWTVDGRDLPIRVHRLLTSTARGHLHHLCRRHADGVEIRRGLCVQPCLWRRRRWRRRRR